MDDNDPEQEADVTPAPTLSAAFLSGGAVAGLEKIRARLLDLTNRNRLLNFRHTASSIRVVDTDPEVVFTRLLNNEEMPFRSVPEPDLALAEPETPDNETNKPVAADHAESL